MNLDNFTERHTDSNGMDRLYKTYLSSDIEYIGKEHGFEVAYDINDFETPKNLLIYTDIFGAISTFIRPCNKFSAFAFFNQAISQPSKISFDFEKYYKDSFYDKYVLDRPVLDSKYSKVAFLPGSNFFQRKVFDIRDIVEFALNGFYIKPHPLTTQQDFDYYKSFIGDKLLPLDTSGSDLFLQADEIATTKFSCFSLYALLFDKKNIFIKGNHNYRGSFKLLNDFLESHSDPKKTLLSLLSSDIPVVFNRELHTAKDVEKSINLIKDISTFEDIQFMFENVFSQKVFQDKTPDKLLELFKNYEKKKHIYSSKIQEKL